VIKTLENSFATAGSKRGLAALLFLVLYLAQPGLALVRANDTAACGSRGEISCCCSEPSTQILEEAATVPGCCSDREDEVPGVEEFVGESCDCLLEPTPIPALDPFLLLESQDGAAAGSFAKWLSEHASWSAEIPRSPLECREWHEPWRVPRGAEASGAHGSGGAAGSVPTPRSWALYDGGLPEWLALHAIARL